MHIMLNHEDRFSALAINSEDEIGSALNLAEVIPAVGSSSKISFGLHVMSMPISSHCFSP